MRRQTARRAWLTPWLAPLVLSGLYLLELWREGVFSDPAMLLTQILFAAPLIVAGSVLLAALEQEARVHTVSTQLQSWVRWTPRALLLGFVAVLALFSLDEVQPGRSMQEIALRLLMHNLPALGLLAVTAIACRWPWVGAVGLFAFAAWWVLVFGGLGFVPSVFLLLAVLPLTVASLFLLSWWLRGPERGDCSAPRRRESSRPDGEDSYDTIRAG
jgi:hypothetical protein